MAASGQVDASELNHFVLGANNAQNVMVTVWQHNGKDTTEHKCFVQTDLPDFL